jgi:Zn-dependent protease with chaperone function
LLSPERITAVIEHERGHAQEHHGLVMLPMLGITNVFGWIPYARLAPREIAALLEMSADDFSARRGDPHTLASALLDMATSGWTPSCALSAADSDVPNRVRRLLSGSRTSKKAATFTALLAVATLAAPLLVAASA